MQKYGKIILLFVLLLGAAIRFSNIPGLTSGPISYTNGLVLAQSADMFSKKGPGLVRAEQGVFRYFVLYAATFFGRSEFILRLPALIFGILSLLYIYRLGSLLFGASAGILSSFLLSVSLWHIQHSNYAEAYTLYAFLALASVFYFCRGLSGAGKSWQAKFIIVSILGFYSFYPFLILIAIELLWFLLRAKHTGEKNKFGISFLIIAVSLLPAITAIYHGMKWLHYSDARWGAKGRELFFTILSLFGGIRNFIPINVIIFLFGLITCMFRKGMRLSGMLLGSLVFIAVLFFGLLAYLDYNIAERYLFFVYPFFLILASRGILSIKNRIANMALILVFCLSGILWILSICGYRTTKYIPEDYVRDYGDYRFLAGYLESNFRDGDAVVIEQGPGIFAVQYYLDMENNFPVKVILPACGRELYFRYDGARLKNLFGLTEFDHDPGRLKKILADYERLWLVDFGHIGFNDKYGKIQNWINDNFTAKKNFPGGVIYLFESGARVKEEARSSGYVCDEDTCFLSCGIKKEKQVIYLFQKLPFVRYWFLSWIKMNNAGLVKLEKEMFASIAGSMRADNGRKTTVAITSLERIIPKGARITDNFMVLNEWRMRYFVHRNKLFFKILPLSMNKNIFQGELLPDFVVSAEPLSGVFQQADEFYELIGVISFNDESRVFIYRLLHSFSFQWTDEQSDHEAIRLAQEYFIQRRYDRCIELLEGAFSDSAMVGRQKALCCIGLASSYVENAILSKKPSDKELNFLNAELYFKHALELIDGADLLNISISSGLGFVYFQMGDLDKAIFHLGNGLKYPLGKFKKEKIDIYTNFGYVHLKKSTDYFNELSEIYPPGFFPEVKVRKK